MEKKILVLGIGNTLLADEGFGVRAVEYLEANYDWPENVQLVDGGTRGLLLMSELMECDLAVVLDVAAADGKPGTFYVLEDENLDRSLSFGQSMHQTSLADVLISCDLAGSRPGVLVFAMEPFDISAICAQLTPQAQSLLPDFCAMVVEQLISRKLIPRIPVRSSH